MGFPDAYQQISSLVNDFKENEKHYLNPSYSEADVRNDFINKFFIALGWDVRHETQKNPYEQEVRVEKPVTVAKAQKRADYTFYLAPNFRDVKFFVEAKKPSHDLENKDYFFQTVRYGWNANTPIAVLTDFEEFIILDCRFRPDINDIINHKLKSFHYSDYADEEKLKEIYYLFSREAVADNSLEKFVDTLPKPRGKKKERVKAKYQNIDEAFLEELDEIRTRLAKSFKKSNSHLTSEELTEAMQRTIDRLVFIRFLEDKLIEPHHYISEFVKPHPNPSPYKGEGLLDSLSLPRRGTKGEVEGRAVAVTAWEKFLRASRTLDAKYNGVVFKKSSVDSRNLVEPDDKTFSSICDELSHENSPYNFDAIPIHILGSIYERFLGKVVNATDKRVTIEEKPEVRKAGGVYYTPQYIVNYIVDNTVIKLVEGKTPKEIAKMRFADIACGSGSFLITVYERLIDYHKQWYQQHPEQAKKDGCILFEGAYRLSLQQKQKILLNNIYGVDLDQQAVEVTQLSLYLKLLEDETTATANDTWVMFKEQLLPDLNKNIICGNSLIGTDILDLTLFPSPPTKSGSTTSQGEGLRERFDELKLKPMDFENVFPEVMRAGGFDTVVGNPPYGMITNEGLKKYVFTEYKVAEGRVDTFEIFVEKAIRILNNKGLLGYIIPNNIFSNLYSRKLRALLIDRTSILEINNFGMDVFKDPTIHTSIIIISKYFKEKNQVAVRRQIESIEQLYNLFDNYLTQSELGNNDKRVIEIFFDGVTKDLLEKLYQNSDKLGNILFTRQCIKTGDDSKYVKKSEIALSIPWKKSLRGKSIDRYQSIEEDLYLKYGNWLARNWKNKSFYEVDKIAVRETGNRIIATIDLEQRYFLSSLYSLYPRNSDDKHSIKYYLAILNSSLSTFIIKKIAYELTKGAFTKMRTNQLAELPIKKIKFDLKSEESLHNQIVLMVDQMLTAKKQLQQAKTESDKNYLNRKCETLDKQIDELVYQLYGLTEEEIKIVEGSVNR